jgi:hypothetical protein
MVRNNTRKSSFFQTHEILTNLRSCDEGNNYNELDDVSQKMQKKSYFLGSGRGQQSLCIKGLSRNVSTYSEFIIVIYFIHSNQVQKVEQGLHNQLANLQGHK